MVPKPEREKMGIGTGASITFQSGFFTNQVLGITYSLERPAVPASHMGSSGGTDWEPGKLYTGTLTVEMLYDGDDIPISASKVAEQITVTLADATTWVFNGFAVGADIPIPLEDQETATITIQMTGTSTGVS